MKWRAWNDDVIVKMDALFENYATFKGEGGKQIYLDHRFDKMLHSRIYGEVVSIPRVVRKIPIDQQPMGLPGYHGYVPLRFRYMDDIEQEIQVGDRLYFHYNTALAQRNWIDVQGTAPNAIWFVRVRYDATLAVVRDGKIIMIGGWVLAEPDKEDWEDILHPVAETVNGQPLRNPDGSVRWKPKDQWIQTKVAPDVKALRAFVRHIGKPLRGDVREMNPGDHIVYRKFADWRVKVEGTEYYCLRQGNILGRFID